MAKLKGWRFAIFIGSFVSAVGGFLYFSAFRAYMNPEPYKRIREQALPKFPPKSPYG